MSPEEVEKIKTKYIMPIEEAELACRILEALIAVGEGRVIPRPDGLTAEQSLDASDPIVAEMCRHAARAAMIYWSECIANANAVQ